MCQAEDDMINLSLVANGSCLQCLHRVEWINALAWWT